MKVYLTKPDFYDVNLNTWWNITDKFIKWSQWIAFLAFLEFAFSKTQSIPIRIVEIVAGLLIFRSTLAFFQTAVRADIKGVRVGGVVWHIISATLTFTMMAGLWWLGWKFAGGIFDAFVNLQKAR